MTDYEMWEAMRQLQRWAAEFQSSRLFVAARGVELEYRERFGSAVPSGKVAPTPPPASPGEEHDE